MSVLSSNAGLYSKLRRHNFLRRVSHPNQRSEPAAENTPYTVAEIADVCCRGARFPV